MYPGNKDALALQGRNTAGVVCRSAFGCPESSHNVLQKYRPYLAPSAIKSGLCSLGKAMTSQGSPNCTAALLWSLLYTGTIWTKYEINLKDIYLMSWCGIKLYILEMMNKSAKMCWFSWNGVISKKFTVIWFYSVLCESFSFLFMSWTFSSKGTYTKKMARQVPFMVNLGTWYRGANSSLFYFIFLSTNFRRFKCLLLLLKLILQSR